MDIRANIEAGKYEAKVPFSSKNRDAYRASSREATDLFRADMAKSFEVPSGPIEKAIWEKAWEDGHADGYNSVYQEYDELVDFFILIKSNL
jgi:hypothetical protein